MQMIMSENKDDEEMSLKEQTGIVIKSFGGGNISKDVANLINDYCNKFTFDVHQKNIKITHDGHTAMVKYFGRYYTVKVGHKIDMNGEHMFIKFGIDTRNLRVVGGFDLRAVCTLQSETIIDGSILPFGYGTGDRSGAEWRDSVKQIDSNAEYVRTSLEHDHWLRKNDILIAEIDTKSRTLSVYTKERYNLAIIKTLDKDVSFVQFCINIGSPLYGSFYPEFIDLVPYRIEFPKDEDTETKENDSN